MLPFMLIAPVAMELLKVFLRLHPAAPTSFAGSPSASVRGRRC
jgi:hypothetical protein